MLWAILHAREQAAKEKGQPVRFRMRREGLPTSTQPTGPACEMVKLLGLPRNPQTLDALLLPYVPRETRDGLRMTTFKRFTKTEKQTEKQASRGADGAHHCSGAEQAGEKTDEQSSAGAGGHKRSGAKPAASNGLGGFLASELGTGNRQAQTNGQNRGRGKNSGNAVTVEPAGTVQVRVTQDLGSSCLLCHAGNVWRRQRESARRNNLPPPALVLVVPDLVAPNNSNNNDGRRL
ncbi:unnamed protein product [Amoebophrya sp. A25]|nr:unnamed protein product [Amoebophrya sp. A25]|eukprot:GSA25T00027772001.1